MWVLLFFLNCQLLSTNLSKVILWKHILSGCHLPALSSTCCTLNMIFPLPPVETLQSSALTTSSLPSFYTADNLRSPGLLGFFCFVLFGFCCCFFSVWFWFFFIYPFQLRCKALACPMCFLRSLISSNPTVQKSTLHILSVDNATGSLRSKSWMPWSVQSFMVSRPGSFSPLNPILYRNNLSTNTV